MVRFRKRYYVFYYKYDSYPQGLGNEVAAEVPIDAATYQEWLAVQRKSAEEWELLYEEFLTIKPGNTTVKSQENYRCSCISGFHPLLLH